MTDLLDDLNPLDPEEHEAQLRGVLESASGSTRVVDLGAGLGRVSIPLSVRSKCSVLAVDNDPGVFADPAWREAGDIELLEEDLLSPTSSWHRRGPFELALCLGNTLSLFQEHEQVATLLAMLADALVPGGRFLIDDFPVWGWEAVHAGDWPGGVSEDGAAQIAWVPGEPVFVFRTGADVRPGSDRPLPGERLLRLWSLSELRHLAAARGLEGPIHHPEHHLLDFRRS